MTNDQIKQALSNEAHLHGFQLVHSNFRSNYFHVKRGAEVRMGYIWKRITSESISAQVNATCKYGDRLDTIKDSLYYSTAK